MTKEEDDNAQNLLIVMRERDDFLKRGKEEEIRNHYQGLQPKVRSIIRDARIGWRRSEEVGQTLHNDSVLVQPHTYDEQTQPITLTDRSVRDGSAKSKRLASGVHKPFRLIEKVRFNIIELARLGLISSNYDSEPSRETCVCETHRRILNSHSWKT